MWQALPVTAAGEARIGGEQLKHHLESRLVLDRLADWQHGSVPAALATVVQVRGSAYRHEGAKLLVAADGSTAGNVSGGCLELDVREVAQQVIASGTAEVRNYCSGTDQVSAWDLGVGCDGQVDVFIEPVTESRQRERALLDLDAPFAVCTVIDSPEANECRKRIVVTVAGGEGALTVTDFGRQVVAVVQEWIGRGAASGLHEVAGRSVFFDIFFPPPQLVVVSAGDDAQPLVRFALDLGFRVSVVDHRPGLLLPERFPGARLVRGDATVLTPRITIDENCYVIIMMHHFAHDTAYLGAIIPTRAAYIGMLGPRQRTERIMASIGAGASEDTRIHGPVGLDIGTDGAEQVALSVLAEIMAFRSGRGARSLRERRVPIHATSD